MRRIAKKQFGIFSSIKSLGNSVRHVGRLFAQPGNEEHQTLSHTNFRFDEESSEWQSLITQNTYEEAIFLHQDMPQLQNFGTVDNPHLVYASEVPFRFVACTGPPSEDDFEYHEVMWILLRNGPLQRCSGCGQVFKLVILRDEFNPENDYYQTGQSEQMIEEFGEADVFLHTSLFRPFMFFTGEHTHMETNSNYVYSLMRMDDHDKYLTDPAFRLEHNQLVEERYAQMVKTIHDIDVSFKENFGHEPILDVSRGEYENLIETEKSIEMLNRHFERMQKFRMRAMIDPLNHERRQDRMENRRHIRLQNPTFYLGDVDEAFLQYQDYFETDCEEEPVDPEKDLERAEQKVLSRPENALRNFEFNESYTTAEERDATGMIGREIFRYKYRQAEHDQAEFELREARRIAKRDEWRASGVLEQAISEYQNLEGLLNQKDLSNVEKASLFEQSKVAYKKIIDLEIEYCLLNYESYYEDETEDVVAGVSLGSKAEQIRGLANVEKLRFLEISDLDLGNLKTEVALTMSKDNYNAQKYGFVAHLLETFALTENIERNSSILGGKKVYNVESEVNYKDYVRELKFKKDADDSPKLLENDSNSSKND